MAAYRIQILPVFEILSQNKLKERGWQFIMLNFGVLSLDGYGHISKSCKKQQIITYLQPNGPFPLVIRG